MDIDTCLRMGMFRHDAREQWQAQEIQFVRHPVMDHRENAGIAEQDFIDAACGGVALIGGDDVSVEDCPDARQSHGELPDKVGSVGLNVGGVSLGMARPITQLQPHLFEQGMQRDIKRMPDVEVFALLAKIGRAQAHGKEGAFEAFRHRYEGLSRRQVTAAGFQLPSLAGAPMLSDAIEGVYEFGYMKVCQVWALLLRVWCLIWWPRAAETNIFSSMRFQRTEKNHEEVIC